MSSQSLLSFLKKLDAELVKGAKKKGEGGRKKALPAIEAYRQATGNKKASTLTYDPGPITDALKYLGAEIDDTIRDGYDKILKELNADMHKSFSSLAEKYPEDVIFRQEGDVVSVAIIKRGKRDNYRTLQGTYTTNINNFYTSFLSLIDKPYLERENVKGKKRKYKTGTSVYAQTHEGGGSNVKHQINDSVYAALEQVNADSTKAMKEIQNELSKLEREDASIILDILKMGKLGEVQLGISSALINAQQGGGIEEQGLKDALNKAMNSLSEFLINTPGSDSLLLSERKKIIEEVIKPFKDRKGITVKHESTKIKENKSKTQLKKKGGKTTIAKGVAAKIASKKRVKGHNRGEKTAPRMGIKNILGVLNNQLPERVAENMGTPRLENRTGRFAQSVRATDATRTKEGYPSIGYTYMKERYGVYESTSGTRFADVERDPRPLIDKSIREIVIGMGLGRIYTRRQ